MAPIQVTAILAPAPGKETRLREILAELANNVQKFENGAHQYQVFEQYDGVDGNVFVVQEIYKDEQAHEEHNQAPYFIAIKKRLPEEGILKASPDVKKIKAVAGFENRNRQLSIPTNISMIRAAFAGLVRGLIM